MPAGASEEFLTAGVDVSAYGVKLAIVSHRDLRPRVLGSKTAALHPIAEQALKTLRQSWAALLRELSLSPADVALVGWTGSGGACGLISVRPFYAREVAERSSRRNVLLPAGDLGTAAVGAALLAATRYRRACAHLTDSAGRHRHRAALSSAVQSASRLN